MGFSIIGTPITGYHTDAPSYDSEGLAGRHGRGVLHRRHAWCRTPQGGAETDPREAGRGAEAHRAARRQQVPRARGGPEEAVDVRLRSGTPAA